MDAQESRQKCDFDAVFRIFQITFVDIFSPFMTFLAFLVWFCRFEAIISQNEGKMF